MPAAAGPGKRTYKKDMPAIINRNYNINMLYEWDERKRAENLAKHGVDFAAAGTFDWDSALVLRDVRFEYGESRFIAIGRIGRRVHVMVFTTRNGNVRLIGLRKANRREIRRYEEA